MENLFVVIVDTKLVGVYTSHRKAAQAIIMDNLPFGYTLGDYAYDFGVEFFTYTDEKNNERVYTLQEVTPDQKA